VRWFATTRGRLGYAVDRYLFYVTGGAAWQNLGSYGHVTIAGVGGWDVFDTRTTRAGYTIGGGAGGGSVWQMERGCRISFH